jgi:Mitochondrial carrier protein
MKTLWNEALTGASSSVFANALVYPLDVIATRSQNKIACKPKSIYAGIKLSLVQTFLSSYFYFYFYAWVRHVLYFLEGNIIGELSLGALAGAMSRMITTPISVLAKRKQVGGKDVTYKDALSVVLKEKGIRGMWSGLKASLVLTVYSI